MAMMVGFHACDVKPGVNAKKARSAWFRRPFVVAFLAFQDHTEAALASLRCRDPRTCHPRRIVPHMLAVPAIEVSHPMTFLILMEADDLTFHASSGARAR